MTDFTYPTPHGDKLRVLLRNQKLPDDDRDAVQGTVRRYEAWIAECEAASGSAEELVPTLTSSLNRYKEYVDCRLVFDSEHDFLYRQKGQLKLDNTILEEFLPRLVGRVLSDQLRALGLVMGPTTAFSHLRFDSSLPLSMTGGGMVLRSKDHDFALARPLFLRASYNEDFGEPCDTSTHLAYVAAEIKTNLDKTMFQEASGTAYDLKLALPNSRYFLLCEWLDMTPISTAVTAIEEVIVLRKARRLPADLRRHFSTAEGRRRHRETFFHHLKANPFAHEAFGRFLSHVERLLGNDTESEQNALERGWF